VPRLERGRIVKAELRDPAGRNPKVRRLVIVTETEKIRPGEAFVCVAVTATLPRRLTAEYVLLPWDRRGHRVTGCTKRCAAKCDWLLQVRLEAVNEISGMVPPEQLRQILNAVQKLSQAGEDETADEPTGST
jgi:mRNA-degrading endonuclease toxin of MazEF toxin-antitoxin module